MKDLTPKASTVGLIPQSESRMFNTNSGARSVRAWVSGLGDALVSSRTVWQLDRRRAFRGESDWGAVSGER